MPPEFLIVATTRPETIMADVALAVKPGGKWAHLVGRKVWRPLHRAEIPIIADDAVEEGFGTGVLKVTPAHDKTDYEIGKRHNLPVIDILTPNGKSTIPGEHDAAELQRPRPLRGAQTFRRNAQGARPARQRGALRKHGRLQRTRQRADRAAPERAVVHANIRTFPEALALLRDGHVKFHPAHWTKVYEHWLENIQDWCISRQVWWGHRIPVWYKVAVARRDGRRIRDSSPDGRRLPQDIRCQIESPGEGWTQDPDTLDTWFSSWLWAYETMRTEDGTRQKFYPTSALVTGPDIIFLWVARMLIAGLHFKPNGASKTEAETLEANLAFKDVYFTGLIRDKQGRKLSKSLGNSPDPLDLIAKYGADGLRFGLVRIAPQGADIRFDEKQIEEGRNFCNKLWNICRFRTLQGADRSQRRSVEAPPLHLRRRAARPAPLPPRRRPQRRRRARRDSISARRPASSTILSGTSSPRASSRRPKPIFGAGRFADPRRHARHVRLRDEPRPAPAPSLRAVRDRGTLVRTRLRHGDDPAQRLAGRLVTPPKTWTARAAEIYATADAGRQLRGEVKLPSNQEVPFLVLDINQIAAAKDTLDPDQLGVLAAFSTPRKSACSTRRQPIPARKPSRRSANFICPPPAWSIPAWKRTA